MNLCRTPPPFPVIKICEWGPWGARCETFVTKQTDTRVPFTPNINDINQENNINFLFPYKVS